MSKIEILRNQKGLSRKQLAEILDISERYILYIEKDKRVPGIQTAKKIADFFGTTIDEIFFSPSSNNSFEKANKNQPNH